MVFQDKCIAYLDILGWKQLVENAEQGGGKPLSDLLMLLDCFGTGKEREILERTGPKCCPAALYREKNLDFQVTQISDCAIFSAEISPAGVINLLWHCWSVVLHFLEQGIMCRGYVKRGKIYHTNKHLVGSGYQEAYAAERNVTAFRREANELGTPFVQIDPNVTEFVDGCGDECVQKMFSRMVRRDRETVALFPFQRLARSFIVAGRGIEFNSEQERLSNHNLRRRIQRYKESVKTYVDETNPDAVCKAAYYVSALDAQLVVCDNTDSVINAFGNSR